MDINVAIKLSAANFYGTDASIKTLIFYCNFCVGEKKIEFAHKLLLCGDSWR